MAKDISREEEEIRPKVSLFVFSSFASVFVVVLFVFFNLVSSDGKFFEYIIFRSQLKNIKIINLQLPELDFKWGSAVCIICVLISSLLISSV